MLEIKGGKESNVMRLTKEQEALCEKAKKTLLFDDLYEFVLSFWPVQIDTSRRDTINCETRAIMIYALEDEVDKRKEFFEKNFEIGNLLFHLNHDIKVAIQQVGAIIDVVRLSEINKSYVRFLFEDKGIKYAVEEDKQKVPHGFWEDREEIWDIDLVREYFKRNKAS